MNKGIVLFLVGLFFSTQYVSCSQELFDAVHASDHEKVEKILTEDPALVTSSVDVNGNNSFMIAVIEGNFSVVQQLLEYKPFLDIQNNDGDTVFTLALKNNHVQIFFLLIEIVSSLHLSKADFLNLIGLKNKEGRNCFFYAALNGLNDIVDYLLVNGVNPEKCDDNKGTTALMAAVYNNHIEIVERLLREVSCSTKLNRNRNQVFTYPAISKVNEHGDTVFTFAANTGNVAMLRLLLSKDPTFINITNMLGLSPLCIAIRKNIPEMVQLLVDCTGININAAYAADNGSTALILATKKGFTNIVRILLNKKPYKYIKDKRSKMAIDYARERGFTEIEALLL